jgi:iron(III) transport system substrate-binding protein
MKKVIALLLGLGLALGAAGHAWAQSRTKLTIYSALENEQLAPFKSAI